MTSAAVTFDIADNPDAPALASLPAQLTPGSAADVARGVGRHAGCSALPPGRYVARAQITRDGKAVGVLVRPFVLERAAGAHRVVGAERAAAAKALCLHAAQVRPAAALERDCWRRLLDMVEKRSADAEGRHGRGARGPLRRRRRSRR